MNGHALGGGAEVAIAADIRVAADDVKIGFNQVSLGIMPAWGGAERLAKAIGRGRALLAIATGAIYDAESARQLGPGRPGRRRGARSKMIGDQSRSSIAGTAPGTSRSVKAVLCAAMEPAQPELEQAATDLFARAVDGRFPLGCGGRA